MNIAWCPILVWRVIFLLGKIVYSVFPVYMEIRHELVVIGVVFQVLYFTGVVMKWGDHHHSALVRKCCLEMLTWCVRENYRKSGNVEISPA